MMAYEKSESAWDSFVKFIYRLQPKTKTLARNLEKILMKFYRQNMSLSFSETYIYIYIYIGKLLADSYVYGRTKYLKK